MSYYEKSEAALPYRADYLAGVERVIGKRQKETAKLRAEYCRDIFENPARYRDEYIEMLGWPLTEIDHSVLPAVEAEKLHEEKDYSVYRLRFEILDGLKLTGLFYRQHKENCPLVIARHGGSGTPELICGAYNGDTSNYNNMFDGVFRRGVHAFAPQLLIWSQELHGVDFSRQEIDSRLRMAGGSVTALEIYGLMKVMDYFETKPFVSSFGMIGLSYGGFYTMFTAAADTRIKAAISCCCFYNRELIPWSDWSWFNASTRFLDSEIACLVYPRRLYITCGAKDPLFPAENVKTEWERLKNLNVKSEQNWVKFELFDGDHEFYCQDSWFDEFVQILDR